MKLTVTANVDMELIKKIAVHKGFDDAPIVLPEPKVPVDVAIDEDYLQYPEDSEYIAFVEDLVTKAVKGLVMPVVNLAEGIDVDNTTPANLRQLEKQAYSTFKESANLSVSLT